MRWAVAFVVLLLAIGIAFAVSGGEVTHPLSDGSTEMEPRYSPYSGPGVNPALPYTPAPAGQPTKPIH